MASLRASGAERRITRCGQRNGKQLQVYLKTHWESAKAEHLTGTYRPMPLRWVETPKPGGDIRLLGITTVMDRFFQQAFLQVMNPIFDAQFSPHSQV
ncbi:hypothetical protein OB236_40030 [Paenibacillus sp. WQ 127069]|uniref:Uncharacterized protein n=1 Tax=Paenibacillus baimaensis TaxID=2982185 RepID=A0ABT2UW04_9BACL|nr:hypothetical protein [Paenibacillus sp. WQ 127069]MCU6798336.1 hypothetical protein [Paenibacillus sp. WQ 127069]